MSTLSRRSFLGAGMAAGAGGRTRPNFLWVSCEDTGPQLGCYGDRFALTPTLDRLAAGGVHYTRAYTVAGVCAPSRSGIITGMYPSTLGSCYMRCSARLPEFVKCFPEYLREAGYYCTNNFKTDYNFPPPKTAWDDLSKTAHWRNRPKDRPFFSVFNIETTHESRVRLRGAAYEREIKRLTASQRRDPAALALPPYYPDTPPSRRDWANYYELITAMDYQVGDRLKEIEDAGLLEDTIVFFWGDHGVGLPRAKRWLYESSTRVPLIVRIPEKFRSPGQARPGTADHQLVSFIDLAPTMLNLAGVPAPKHFQGRAFLGPNLSRPREHIFGARDRMDERYDTVRVVRDRRYRYLRNYEPQKPYAQYLEYMEQGFVMKELRRLKAEGGLPAAARLFMGESKPVEELYDVDSDPHEIVNLAESPAHRATLERLRKVHETWAVETRDVGLLPEAEVAARGERLGSRYAILRQPGSQEYLRRLRALVEAVNRDRDPALVRRALAGDDAVFRYWAVIGLARDKEAIRPALADAAPVVRIAAARALGGQEAVAVLAGELKAELEWTRLRAAIALDELGAREALRPALDDKSQYVRRVAAHGVAG